MPSQQIAPCCLLHRVLATGRSAQQQFRDSTGITTAKQSSVLLSLFRADGTAVNIQSTPEHAPVPYVPSSSASEVVSHNCYNLVLSAAAQQQRALQCSLRQQLLQRHTAAAHPALCQSKLHQLR